MKYKYDELLTLYTDIMVVLILFCIGFFFLSILYYYPHILEHPNHLIQEIITLAMVSYIVLQIAGEKCIHSFYKKIFYKNVL